MQLDSYLEIFTTLYGWAFANLIGEIITGTGLAVLPFGLVVFKTWHEAKDQGMGFDGVRSLLESIETRLITMMFVMATCFATTPITSLSNINMSYTPARSFDGKEPQAASLKGGTGTGYDQAMADAVSGSFSKAGNLSYVPAWWYTVMGISSGVNGAFRAGLTNSSRDLRMIEDLARMATIEDPGLLYELQRFYSECFIPARSKYLAMDRNALSSNGKSIIAEGNSYGPTDVDWVGSQLFRTEDGFYGEMRSYNPVPGWTIDFSRDTDYIQTPAPEGSPEHGYVNPDWGRPTCKQWWETSETGIREKLISNTSTWRSLTQAAQNTLTFKSADEAKDSIARLGFEKANPTFISPDRIMGDEYGTGTNIWRSMTGAASTFGVANKALDASLAMIPLLNALPMVQALVLMALYMFLPLIVFLSGYDLKMMLYGALAIFTVKFWAVMWYVARWIDAHLIDAMYPGFSGSALMQEITQMASAGQPQLYKRMILNILLMLLFIGLPAIWTSMMGWIGYRMSTGLEFADGANSLSVGAASSTKSGAIKGASSAMRK
ncbi:conjugal transfer protein TraG N-terminal domain-containing protein [Delftia sp. PS-11]|uniref:conjugal transfer protein TraG N-terminal domain-containing protein n=1 Tax=Delftia sp. PS-11 TaxID=2767222 RepID=UPI0024564481|nr:conjugal transfer protein TraG N-terminal domain-containing protein [Delftia sp. PS-11]KAJ8744142.1 conjugal transfer protein TraG N-terminal domain-containing protein [Delftia sp. PS-11]